MNHANHVNHINHRPHFFPPPACNHVNYCDHNLKKNAGTVIGRAISMSWISLDALVHLINPLKWGKKEKDSQSRSCHLEERKLLLTYRSLITEHKGVAHSPFSLRIMKISGHTNGSVDQLIGRQVPILSNNAPILYPSIHITKSLSIVVVDDTFIKVLVKICESVSNM